VQCAAVGRYNQALPAEGVTGGLSAGRLLWVGMRAPVPFGNRRPRNTAPDPRFHDAGRQGVKPMARLSHRFRYMGFSTVRLAQCWTAFSAA
jgi:hypothetical protein